MKRPLNMTMSELIALPVINDVETLRACGDEVPLEHGGAFTDDGGRLWRTVRTGSGWARYPAYLAVLADALDQMRNAPIIYESSTVYRAVPGPPRASMLAAGLRALGLRSGADRPGPAGARPPA